MSDSHYIKLPLVSN